MNLYVDDVRACPFVNWTVARTIADAKEHLASGQVRHCSLDHDMGACDDCIQARRHIGDMTTPETTYLNWCPHFDDGTKLVRWMVETGHWSAHKPVVHSANPVGAARMRGLIDRYFGSPPLGPVW